MVIIKIVMLKSPAALYTQTKKPPVLHAQSWPFAKHPV